jgi:chemotaxis protein methyltransferase CheR
MTLTITNPLMQQLNDMVAIRMGLYFPLERQIELERGVASAAKEFGYSDTSFPPPLPRSRLRCWQVILP